MALVALGYLTRQEPQQSLSEDAKWRAEIESHYPLPRQFARETWRSTIREALRGSQSAAGDLIGIFENCATRAQLLPEEQDRLETCRRKFDFWSYVAAINGDRSAASMVVSSLSSDKCEDSYRAEFWLSRVPDSANQEPWVSKRAELRSVRRQCQWRFHRSQDMVKIRGLKGDPEAAFRLYRSRAVSCHPASVCQSEVIFWLSVAAENGSNVAAGELGQRLMNSGSCDGSFRAYLWLTRAKLEAGPAWNEVLKLGCV